MRRCAGELDEPAHHIERPFAHGAIRAGDRQARRSDQQPVQPAHRNPGLLRGAAQLCALLTRHAVGLVAESERRQLEPSIAELGRNRALARKLELAQHLIAQRKFHRVC
jgi:hypothetical protein